MTASSFKTLPVIFDAADFQLLCAPQRDASAHFWHGNSLGDVPPPSISKHSKICRGLSLLHRHISRLVGTLVRKTTILSAETRAHAADGDNWAWSLGIYQGGTLWSCSKGEKRIWSSLLPSQMALSWWRWPWRWWSWWPWQGGSEDPKVDLGGVEVGKVVKYSSVVDEISLLCVVNELV